MKNYIYIQSDLNTWYELALRLNQKNVAKPVLWLGDDSKVELVQKKFSCETLAFYDQYKIGSETFVINELANSFFLSDRYNYVKDICIKMMDREDISGLVRYIDREAIFYYWLLWTCNKIHKLKPDFLLMSESPHSYLQYLIYELCEFTSIKTLSFGMITKFSPVLYLRNGIYGENINFDKKPYDKSIDNILINRAKDILKKDLQKNDFLGNIILQDQIDLHNKITSLSGKLKYNLRETIKTILSLVPHSSVKKVFIKNRPAQVAEIEKIIYKRYGLSHHKTHRIQENIWHELQNTQQLCSKSIGNNKYVYISLHYEPERNSCPDGYTFYEQVKLISAIRAIIPSDINLLVKEHPSQTSRARIGYVGRSSFFYQMVSKMSGVALISSNVDSKLLINGAQFTASLGGTMSLETALIGKKSIIFGHPWFKGAPNILSFHKSLTYDEIILSENFSSLDVINWVSDFIRVYGFPGIQNPSGKKYFNDLISKAHIWDSGLSAMENAIKRSIEKVDTEHSC